MYRATVYSCICTRPCVCRSKGITDADCQLDCDGDDDGDGDGDGDADGDGDGDGDVHLKNNV